MLKYIITSLFFLVGVSLNAKENPRIDKKELSSLSLAEGAVNNTVRKGDSYYRKGLYDAALQQYMRIFAVKDDHSPLNYKIAVSHLYGINPKNALEYFDRTDPSVASDYYCLRGIALIYHKRYDEAKEAFRQYSESLPAKEAVKMQGKINRFIAISDFSAKAVLDSVPVFIINAGPQVNSYYDDYSAVELVLETPGLYFTSRRPKNDKVKMDSRSTFSERILFSPQFVNGVANDAQDFKIKSRKNLSVAGVDSSMLYYYKKLSIYRSQIREDGKPTKKRRLFSPINKRSATEGAISFAANGDAYFISTRRGGQGGKDIWYAEKKGKKSYYRPVNMRYLNTALDEECVYVSPDGNTLYFSSNGFPGMGGFDIYKSEKTANDIWSDPVNMGYPINGPDDDLFYRLTSDPYLALLSSKKVGGFGGLDVYYVKTDLRIPFELSGNVTDINTGETLNATVRLFDRASNMPVGATNNDVGLKRYVLKMEDGGDLYLQVEAPGYRLATIDFTNPTMRHEKLHQDFELEKLQHPYTISGYVTDAITRRPVQAEVVIRLQGNDQARYRTVSDILGYYSITLADKENFDILSRAPGYFDYSEKLSLKNVEEESGDKNIALQRSSLVYMVSGTVTSEKDKTPLIANIRVTKTEEDGTVGLVMETVTDKDGNYELVLPSRGPYAIEFIAEKHFFSTKEMRFTDDNPVEVNYLALTKIEVGAKVTIDYIQFNTGASTLRPESFAVLNRLVHLLRVNPSVKIEVSGHTDNTGSAATNRTLSRNRALTVRNYLISQGIAGERVVHNGYGSERPIAPNTNEEGRAANRRVEVEVLSL